MRGMRWILTVGVTLFAASIALSQEVRKTIQVVVGPDGAIKIIDSKTGKEEILNALKVLPGQEPQDKEELLRKARAQEKEALERAREALEHAREQLERGKEKADQPPATLEQKVDRLLKEVGELRKDVNQIKSRMDGGAAGMPWQQFVPGDWQKWIKDKKGFEIPGGKIEIDPATLKEILKKLEAGKGKEIEKKKETPPPNDRKELERRLERILEEAEALRKEISKQKKF